MEYEITEKDREFMAAYDREMKRYCGRRNVELIMSEDGVLDRKRFGKLHCQFCEHTFNPFYHKELKQESGWEWRWQGAEYKEPEMDY